MFRFSFIIFRHLRWAYYNKNDLEIDPIRYSQSLLIVIFQLMQHILQTWAVLVNFCPNNNTLYCIILFGNDQAYPDDIHPEPVNKHKLSILYLTATRANFNSSVIFLKVWARNDLALLLRSNSLL